MLSEVINGYWGVNFHLVIQLGWKIINLFETKNTIELGRCEKNEGKLKNIVPETQQSARLA